MTEVLDRTEVNPFASPPPELDSEPTHSNRRRAVIAALVIATLVGAGVLLLLVGSALGANPAGGCGGG